jgi:hypothetical protein
LNREQVHARSAVEALRSGVPSPLAVRQLGTTQDHIRDLFDERMDAVEDGRAIGPLVISADFGAGKSHLLNYLRARAADRGFVTTLAVVSPEMPLGNAHVVLKAIAEGAAAPGRAGEAATALASELRTGSEGFAELRRWSRNAGIDERFTALLHLFEELRADEEFRSRIIGDFEGRPISLTEIRQQIKEIGQAAAYALKGRDRKNALLAHDRIRLLAQLYRTCGCKGWVVLFDELERMSVFTIKQRLVCWDELGWWRQAAQEAGTALIPVFAGVIPALIDKAVLDRPRFESQTRLVDGDSRDERCLDGIDMVVQRPEILSRPTAQQKEAIKYRVKEIYERAYGVQMPDVPGREDVVQTIRSEIRRWITRWDLHRLDPGYQASIDEERIETDTREVPDEMMPSDGSEGE